MSRPYDDPEFRRARAQVAIGRRYQRDPATDPEFAAAIERMRVLAATAHVRAIVAESPPLTMEQKARLAAILLTDSTPAAS